MMNILYFLFIYVVITYVNAARHLQTNQSCSNQNLIVNGDFSDPPLKDWEFKKNITGWSTNQTTNLSIYMGPTNKQNKNISTGQSVELDSGHNIIQTIFNLKSQGSYKLKINYTHGLDKSKNKFNVIWNGVNLIKVDPIDNDIENQIQLIIKAKDGQNKLQILGGGDQDGYGSLITLVSLNYCPNITKIQNNLNTTVQNNTNNNVSSQENATTTNTSNSNATTPNTTTPQNTTTLNATTPNKTTPENASTPNATTPNKTEPENATTPNATTPNKTTPDNATTPNKTTPENATTPNATTPNKTTPDNATTPNKTTPENATTPNATTPNKTTPSGTTPIPPSSSPVVIKVVQPIRKKPNFIKLQPPKQPNSSQPINPPIIKIVPPIKGRPPKFLKVGDIVAPIKGRPPRVKSLSVGSVVQPIIGRKPRFSTK